MYGNVLVTLDGSAASERILQEVSRLDGDRLLKVTLLRVADEPGAVAETPHPLVAGGAVVPGGTVSVPPPRTIEDRGRAFERVRHELTAYLEAKVGELKGLAGEIETDVRFGDPVEEIVAEAKEKQVDLIMMATHGRAALSQVIFGNVAAGVIRSGIAPVLLVRPERLRERDDA